MRTWLITGVSSGFGNEMAKQILAKDDRFIGTSAIRFGGVQMFWKAWASKEEWRRMSRIKSSPMLRLATLGNELLLKNKRMFY